MFFILLYGWDGLGYDRFLYDRDQLAGCPAWTPGAGTSGGVLEALVAFGLTLGTPSGGVSVLASLLTDALWLLAPFILLFSRWLGADSRVAGVPAPPVSLQLASYLAGVFVIGLGGAAFCATTVGLSAQWLQVGEIIWHGSFYAPSTLARHALSYLIGLPLGLAILWFALLRPGMPLFRLLEPLTLEVDGRGRTGSPLSAANAGA